MPRMQSKPWCLALALALGSTHGAPAADGGDDRRRPDQPPGPEAAAQVGVRASHRADRDQRVGVAALVLVFWDRPTGKVVLGISLVLLVVLAVIEFLSRPPEQPVGPQLQT